jgi:hypothetical protein
LQPGQTQRQAHEHASSTSVKLDVLWQP